MKYFYCLLFCFLMTAALHAQAPTVMTSANVQYTSTFSTANNLSLYFTTGDPHSAWRNNAQFSIDCSSNYPFGASLTNTITSPVSPIITVFPNPTTDNIYFNTGTADIKKSSVQILSTTGVLLQSSLLIANAPISLQGFDNGIYLIKLILPNATTKTFKIVKI